MLKPLGNRFQINLLQKIKFQRRLGPNQQRRFCEKTTSALQVSNETKKSTIPYKRILKFVGLTSFILCSATVGFVLEREFRLLGNLFKPAEPDVQYVDFAEKEIGLENLNLTEYGLIQEWDILSFVQNIQLYFKHSVAPGETLSSIAAEYTGDQSNSTRIAEHNNINNPDQIMNGLVLDVPVRLSELDFYNKREIEY